MHLMRNMAGLSCTETNKNKDDEPIANARDLFDPILYCIQPTVVVVIAIVGVILFSMTSLFIPLF